MAKFITLDNLRKFKKLCDDAYKVDITLDDTPTPDSNNPVTSGGVKEYVDNTFINKDAVDHTPTSDSNNPVTSGGVKTYVDTAIINAINEAIGSSEDLLGNTDDLEV